MNKQFSDDELIKLYQQNNDALPPKHIDEAILVHAANTVNSDSNHTLENKAPKRPNRWWQYSGLAAAITAVAVLAPWQYYQDPMLVSIETTEKSVMPEAKQASENIQRLEVLADHAQKERVEVTERRLEHSVPEPKLLARRRALPVIYGHNLIEPDAEFKDILVMLENKDRAGAETALIKLLKEKPEYHDDMPEALDELYQTLVANGKIVRPEALSKSQSKAKNKPNDNK
jgi:nucleotide-binding universal stress UspA family protein